MEGARMGMAPQAERAEPGTELARRLAGERDDEDVAGIGGPRGEPVRDAAREHSGLAGAGPGDDAERRARARDRGALRFVEVGQQVHRGHLREGVGHCPVTAHRYPQGLWRTPVGQALIGGSLGKTRFDPE